MRRENVRLTVGLRSAFLVIALVLAMALSHSPPALGQEIQFSMKHSVNIGIYGFVFTNTTIYAVNNGTANLDFSKDVEVRYHFTISPRIAKISLEGPKELGLKVEKRGNETFAIASGKLSIAPKEKVEFTFKTTYKGLIVATKGGYISLIPLLPNLNIEVPKADVRLSIPSGLSFQGQIQGLKPVGSSQNLEGSLEVKPKSERLESLFFLPAGTGDDFNILSFPEVAREVSVEPKGSALVKERITVVSEDDRELKSLKLNILDKQLKRAMVLPTSDPPLFNAYTAEIRSGTFEFGSGGMPKKSLKRGDRLTFELEYPIPPSLSAVREGFVEIILPRSPSVIGVAEKYSVYLRAPKGYAVSNNERSWTFFNATYAEEGSLTLRYQPGIAWSAEEILPPASLIFILTLVFLLLRRPGRRAEPILEQVSQLVTAYEEKIASMEGSVSSLTSQGLARVSRRSLEESRRQVDEVRRHTATRISELKSSLRQDTPELQRLFSEITAQDREFERNIRDLISLFEQYLSRRINMEAADRLVSERRKRAERASQLLTEKLKALTDEYSAS